MYKEGRTVGGNKGRVKKVAKILTSFESLLQEKVVIWQDSKVFLAVCDRVADVYSQEVEVIGNGQQKCQSHHSVFYTLLHKVTMWKVLVENTFGKSLENVKMTTILRKDNDIPRKQVALMANLLED